MKHFFAGLLLLALISPLTSHAQNVQAAEFVNTGKYNEAITILETARNKGNAELPDLVNLAYCYIMLHDYQQAGAVYAEVVQNKKATSREYFLYGELSRINGKYEEARQWYQEFLKSAPDDRIARLRIQSCDSLLQWTRSKSAYTVVNAEAFNTSGDEHSPAVSSGELYWISNSRDLLTAAGGTTRFTDPAMSFIYHKPEQGGTTRLYRPFADSVSYTYDMPSENRQLLVVKAVKRTPDGEKFGPSVIMTGSGDRDFSEFRPEGLPAGSVCTHPFLASDGHRMYFSSNMPGGSGGVDLYYSDYKDGRWQSAVNLGPAVNTPGDEMFPVVSPDGTHLWFASDGHPGYGNQDIFCSVLSDGQWGKPANLQAPVNSIGNDFGFIFTGKYNGYFVSNRYEGSKGGNDIYAFRLPEPVVVPVKDTLKPPVVQTVPEDRTFVFFRTASADIAPVFETSLNRVVAVMKEKPYLKVTVIAQADARGSEALNDQLAGKRASSVAAWLTARGIDAGRILTKPAGVTQNRDVIRNQYHVQIGYMPSGDYVAAYSEKIRKEATVRCLPSGKGYAYVAGQGSWEEMNTLRRQLKRKYGVEGYVTASFEGYYMEEIHYAPCRRAELVFSK